MAKERKTTLAAVASPVAASAGPDQGRGADRGGPRPGRKSDPRETGAAAALYARVPQSTKRSVDVAAAMLGCGVADLVGAILAEHVDPRDDAKMARLEHLLQAR